MNNMMKTILKLSAAITAVAGIAYLVVKNMDAITDWLKNLCPKCNAEPIAEETAAEAPAEEAAAEEPVEEVAPIPEGEPVAEDSDFEA